MGVGGARTHLVNLENLSDEELMGLQEEFNRLAKKHAKLNTGQDVAGAV